MNSIPYEERLDVYNAAIKKWGTGAQMLMAVEEMSELTKEICKAQRGNLNLEAMADEIADVTIMCEQLRLVFGLNDFVCDRMDFKVVRLRHRVEEDNGHE